MDSIRAIEALFASAKTEDRSVLYQKFADDPRNGVAKLIERYQKQDEKLRQERKRLEQMREYENRYASYPYICGIDEAGRGPLAGPVVAGAVILPKDCEILYLDDSKKLSAKKREELYKEILEQAVAVGVGTAGPGQIDEINILQATYEAMRMAIGNLNVAPDLLLNDAVTIPGVEIEQVPIIKGDAKSVSIAAASIVAKVTRDRMMAEYDRIYPGYGFAGNKGYGSAAHISALKELGPTPIHRRSFIGNFVGTSKTGKKQNNRALGGKYERLAGAYLERKGYQILLYNYRCRFGEIDLIARDGNDLVFCEVKYRADQNAGHPLEAVDAGKQRVISRCALQYLAEHKMGEVPCRFDAVGICGTQVTLVKNAFEWQP